MLRLKGQTESGEWVEFSVMNIVGEGFCQEYLSAYLTPERFVDDIRTDTIQPADDPRKQMLDEIREQINNLPGTNYTCAGDAVYIPHEINRDKVLSFLAKLEAKL